jgi:cell fate (sporulation/competence/biofilm development) regulator YlbF (YheA/YmcA/DUF963 family)
MFTKKNVITARFINDGHTTIEVLHTIKGDEKAHAYILEYDKDSADYQDLEKAGWDLERIQEETAGYKRAASLQHDTAVAAAAQQWLKENPTTVENIVNVPVTDIIGSIIDKNEDEDTIFKAKLAIMELDAVKKSKATKLKQEIRKAKTLIEVVSYLQKVMK